MEQRFSLKPIVHLKRINSSSIILLIIPLLAAAFTHLWNPTGYPYPLFDESTYIGRAMHIIIGQGVQDKAALYDHPFFGQIFLASSLKIIGYPESLHPSVDVNSHSIESLWLFPREIMGILGVIDTLIIYKISERRYSRRTALIASILFAVMPATLLNRWILLDSIQLPFTLSSILFAVYSKQLETNNRNKKKIMFVLLSGIFLGTSIFTKMPAFAMIPLVGFLIFSNNSRKFKPLLLWFIPVILIPLIWPTYAIFVGEYDLWLDGLNYQTHRNEAKLPSLFESLFYLFNIDLILPILGFAGLVYTSIRKDLFIFLWVIPFVIFYYWIGLVDLSHLIVLLPAFSIGAGILISDLSNKLGKKIASSLPYVVISGITVFGLVNVVPIISENVTTPYFRSAAFVVDLLYRTNHESDNGSNFNDIMTVKGAPENNETLISTPFYSWIPLYVFRINADYMSYEEDTRIKTDKVFLVADPDFVDAMSSVQVTGETAARVNKMYDSCVKHVLVTFEPIVICSLK